MLRSDETRANQPENIFKREVYSNVLNAEAKKWQSGIYSAVIRAEESSQETERRHWVKSIFSSVLDAESVRDTNERTRWASCIYSSGKHSEELSPLFINCYPPCQSMG